MTSGVQDITVSTFPRRGKYSRRWGRFWTMLAHYHGQTWNAAESARSLGVSEPTVRRYLDILSGVFMIRHGTPT